MFHVEEKHLIFSREFKLEAVHQVTELAAIGAAFLIPRCPSDASVPPVVAGYSAVLRE